MKDSIYRLNLRQLGAALREGSLSSIAVLEHYLERIGRLDGELNCLVHLDAEGARAAARQADERFATGKPLGPLDGIPVAIKDNLLVADMPCVWGTKLYRDYIAAEDELPVRLLRQAGAVIVGKTNVPEFTLRGFTGNAVFGSTGNPWNPALTPGGSSGGSVAAVAAGLVPYSLGTDGGGSIRRPAGYTGIVGLKPSIGRIPRQGGLPPLLADCEVVGPLARTVDDVRLIMSVIGCANSGDPRSFGFPDIGAASATPERKRILFVERFGDAPVDPEIVALCSRAADRFATLGHEVERGPLPLDLASVNAGWPILANTGLAKMAALDARFHELVSVPFSDQAKAGAKLSVTDYLTFIETLDAFRVAAARLFKDFDVVLTPASAAHAWPRDSQFPPVIDGKEAGPRGHAVFTNWVNACGHPGISIPVGRGAGGMPVGLQAVAAFGADDALLDLAGSFEQAYPWADRWPELALR
ncbi:amidase [Rhizobiaceae bacterium BDR2-2]|uniref:Amidase n=1 Tax=Ectorhizobium quercum TaxID=2965071 RepID=A0AAE3N1S1_9HYPH|nr:amidase [Ectorhizobium quercum]MCX8997157.1 amidase [Ectorhizobium quercum]